MRRMLWMVGAAGLVSGPLLVAGVFSETAAAADLAACLDAPTRDCLTAVAAERMESVAASPDRSSLLAALAEEQARGGDVDAARATFARAIAEATAAADPLAGVTALDTIARLQSAAGQDGDARATLAKAAALARDAAPAAGGRGADEWSGRLRVLAEHQRELGDAAGAAASLADAVEVAAAITDPFRRGTELMLAAGQQAARGGDSAAALATFAAAKDAAAEATDEAYPSLRAVMLLSIAQTELEAGLRDPGVDTLRGAGTAAAALTNPSDRARLETQIALALLRATGG